MQHVGIDSQFFSLILDSCHSSITALAVPVNLCLESGKIKRKKHTIMSSSEFMDKQITELSRSQSQDFSLFSNPHHHNDDDDEELSPTFRFHLIRPVVSTHQSHADDSESLISAIDRKMKELGENLFARRGRNQRAPHSARESNAPHREFRRRFEGLN